MCPVLAISSVFLLCISCVAGHVGLWHESMFGRCGDNNQCENTNQPAFPLSDLTFDKWWWHGYLDLPPGNDSVMALPAGKNITMQVAGNVAFTSLGQHPDAFWPGGAGNTLNESIVSKTFWNNGPSRAGNLHTTGHFDVAGCALSIAYTDDPKIVRPEDMVIFSVQQDCPWHRDAVFDIPAAMPACPNDKCMCSWWWIHNSDGGGDEMYQSPFQCNITFEPGQKISTTPLGRPVPSTNCENDKAKCVKGPKLPMYWKQTECNNMPEPGGSAPTYNDRYGFFQGAQNDIFETINNSNWTCPQSKAPGVFANQPQEQPAQSSDVGSPPAASGSSSTSTPAASAPGAAPTKKGGKTQCRVVRNRNRNKRRHSWGGAKF